MDVAKIEQLKQSLEFEYETQYKALLLNISGLLEVRTARAELIRLMAVPLIYSCWEGFFKTATAKCFIVVRDFNERAADASAQQRASWLKRAPFFMKYVELIRNMMELDADVQAGERLAKQKSKVKKGQHVLLATTLSELDNWHSSCLDKSIEPESLILTYSNVNRDVVDLNANIVGLDTVPTYSQIDFSQLDGLVGKRNSVGHGGISDGDMLTYPGHLEVKGYVDYAQVLTNGYRIAVLDWLEMAKSA